MSIGEPASPPCFVHDLVYSEGGFEVRDRQTEIDVARWRRSERRRLIDARLSIPVAERAEAGRRIAADLDRMIDPESGPVVALYWPFRGEIDLRGWMRSIWDRGAQIGLPVVIEKQRPLIFRQWSPNCRMERGVWSIPIPVDDDRIVPDIVIAPVVGADRNGFRLGYGGGFYDRTLADMTKKPLVIGCGHPVAAIETIFPLPHDIPMDRMVLGETVRAMQP